MNSMALNHTPEKVAAHIFNKVSSLETDSDTDFVSNILSRDDKNEKKKLKSNSSYK